MSSRNNKNRANDKYLVFIIIALLFIVYFIFSQDREIVESKKQTQELVVTTVVSKKSDKKEPDGDNKKERAKSQTSIDYIKCKVVRVVDGDTIVVKLDGRNEKIRLSGINTPESVGDYKDNPQFYGVEASEYVKKALDKKWVYLSFDKKKYDKYDRILAYVWTDIPSDDLSNLFNAELISKGYAKWYNDKENKLYAEFFEELEKNARKEKLGLWQRK